ncbi:MAG: glucose/arabinose dehydrogenase, partial [Pseudohongiellaceae bacterium]
MTRPPLRTLAAVRHSLALLLCAASAWAQAGDGKDAPGSVQPDLPRGLVVPAAPVLSPADALAAFDVADDLVVELVAAEPLIHDPVAACFDGEGRLWVCEMRGFMPDADGLGEDAPVGAVVVLHDDDGDGAMDRRVVFLDELVLPRGVLPVRGGALVIAPPEVLFCRDTDGDGRADTKIVVESGVSGLVNPEHALNGLLATLDNRIAVANHPTSYGWSDGAWITEANGWGGQWGQTMDDWGRLYFNTNSDLLRAHAVAPRYGVRNRNHGTIAGMNQRVVDDQSVWPIRMTPGVNRGYRPGVLEDWKLARVTAACGPLIHRGDGLPDGYRGAAFVCEPAANLVQHYKLWDDETGSPKGAPATPGQAVLASTDERFRPVNLLDGPDGAVYVVDMYRGILQHKIFMTTFLRRQVDRRGLAEPLGLGRIWRLVRKGERPTAADPLSQLTPLQVVARLEHSNGFLRDQAQQALVGRGADGAETDEALSRMAITSTFGHGRAHALWTLAGRGTLDQETLAAALNSPQPEARRAAAQVAETWLLRRPDRFAPALLKLTRDEDVRVSRQALLSLGVKHPLAAAALLSAALDDVSTAERRSAILSGVPGGELELCEGLLGSDAFSQLAPGRDQILFFLARAVAREGRVLRVDNVLSAAGHSHSPWQQQALLEGLLAPR